MFVLILIDVVNICLRVDCNVLFFEGSGGNYDVANVWWVYILGGGNVGDIRKGGRCSKKCIF